MVSEAATALGVELIARTTRTPEEITAAIEHIPEQADAIFLLPDTLLGDYATEFAKLQLPTSAVDPNHLTVHGVLTSYGIDHTASGSKRPAWPTKSSRELSRPICRSKWLSSIWQSIYRQPKPLDLTYRMRFCSRQTSLFVDYPDEHHKEEGYET